MPTGEQESYAYVVFRVTDIGVEIVSYGKIKPGQAPIGFTSEWNQIKSLIESNLRMIGLMVERFMFPMFAIQVEVMFVAQITRMLPTIVAGAM